MFLVVRRGGVTSMAEAGVLAGAAAVACLRTFAGDERIDEWRPRPGKVTLRARGGQWAQLLEQEPHVLAGDAVAALPPRRRSERGELLERMQAMTTELEPAPEQATAEITYLINPRLQMSSGKTLAQIAHAAVQIADARPQWADDGCPAAVAVPAAARFDALCARDDLLARVVDAGLTEVPPGTVTVLCATP